MKTLAIIPSAGMARRMGSRKKVFLPLLGRPILAHTLSAFESSKSIDSVLVVVRPGDVDFCLEEVVKPYGFKKVEKVIDGGPERQDSVYEALKAVRDRPIDIIAVHDGARPLVTPDLIGEVVGEAKRSGAAIAAVPIKDTVKEVTEEQLVLSTLERGLLRAVQTPQAFRKDLLFEAFEKALRDGFYGTDESSLVERAGLPVRVVMGSYENIKITTDEDLLMAECILSGRSSRK